MWNQIKNIAHKIVESNFIQAFVVVPAMFIVACFVVIGAVFLLASFIFWMPFLPNGEVVRGAALVGYLIGLYFSMKKLSEE